MSKIQAINPSGYIFRHLLSFHYLFVVFVYVCVCELCVPLDDVMISGDLLQKRCSIHHAIWQKNKETTIHVISFYAIKAGTHIIIYQILQALFPTLQNQSTIRIFNRRTLLLQRTPSTY